MVKLRKLALVALGGLALSACEQAPTGQVLAIVDGTEITMQEVNGELAQLRPPPGMEPEEAQRLALQRVIDRHLLANAAREEGVDKTPEFYIRQRQMIDDMLVEEYREKLKRAITVPTDSDIRQYAEANPELFEERKFLLVDQVSFPVLPNPEDMTAFEDDETMDDVADTLRDLGVRFQRRNAEMDTALLGARRLERIRALPEGQPFILPGPRIVTIAVVEGERPAGRDFEGIRSEVADRISREELVDLLEARLESAKQSAEIQYQEGYGPEPLGEEPAE